MRLLQTVQTSYDEGSYVMDGCLCNGGSSLALSISNYSIRLYDTNTTAFQLDLKEHTTRITDVVCTPAQPSMLYSSQEDTGVMISDVRQGKAVRFLTEMCSSGLMCNSVGVSPSGGFLAVGTGGDVQIVDTRTWCSVRAVETMHLDDVTRVRFLDEHIICSAGEDQMINFISTAPNVVEDDMLLQATNCREVITKMTCFPELSAITMIGSCENSYVFPYDLEQTEVRYPRPDFSTYLVDWAVVGGQLQLISGVRDDEGNAGPLSVLTWSTKAPTVLPFVHKELARVAIGFGDRLITGGEDGLLAFWAHGEAAPGTGVATAASTSSSSRGAVKERTTLPSATSSDPSHGPAKRSRGRPY